MKKLFVILLAAMLVIGLVFVLGCSDDDDDDGTGPIVLPAGDINDPLFVAAWGPIEEASGQVPMGLAVMMYFLQGVLDSAAALDKGFDMKGLSTAEPDSIWYDEVTKYWHAEGEYAEMYWYGYERDSAQFMHGGTAVQWPDTLLLTRINGGSYTIETYTMEIKSPASPNVTDTSFEFAFNGYLSGPAGAIPSFGDVTAGGSGNMRLHEQPGKSPDEIWCEYDIKDNFVATNIQFNILALMMGGACPDAGTIIHNSNVTLDCDGDTTFTHTGSWYMKETFAGDSVHYIVENGVYRWDFWNECYVITR